MKLFRTLAATALLALVSFDAFAQSVQQSGTITVGQPARWISNGVIGAGGTSADGLLTTLGITNANLSSFCIGSARASDAGRNLLCFGARTNSAAVISLQNYGTASAQNLQFNINGNTVTLPTGGGTFALVSGSETINGLTTFTGSGGLIQNSGLTATGGAITAGAWQGTSVALGFGGTGGTSAATARTNLGLGSMATQAASAVAITGGTVTGMPAPSSASDVANKFYVDSVATGLNVLTASVYATAAVLPNTPTYGNGASGVGATLTAGANAAIVVDGASPTSAQRILVKNQASAFQNGIYTVTTVGDGSNPWVLTRATDFDTAAEMLAGSYTFVSSGATNVGSSFTLTGTVTTVGTTAANFTLFNTVGTGVSSIGGASGAITLGTGLSIGSNILTNSGVSSFGGATGAITIGSTLAMAGNAVSVNLGSNNTWTGTAQFNAATSFKNGKPWADVTAWGAVCDNTTDDTTALQNAINAVNSSGGVVFFPPTSGNCKVTSVLTITGNVILLGSGAGATGIVATTNIGVISFGPALSYAGIEKLSIIGYLGASPTQNTVAVGNNALVNFRDCQIWGGNVGLLHKGADGQVENCYISAGQNGLASIFSQGANWYNRVKIDTFGYHVTNGFYQSTPFDGVTGMENKFVMSDFSGDYTRSIYIDDGGFGSYTVISEGVFSSSVQIINTAWFAMIGGTTGAAIEHQAGVLTLVGNFALGSTTVTGAGTVRNCSANYRITC